MPSAFIGSAPGNFQPGRPAAFTPEGIVLHRTGGSRDSLRARYNDPASSQSAHYVVCRDGGIDQYVQERDTAFHAGSAVGATWSRLRPRVNPNFYTIGIELEGAAADDWPEPQVAAAAILIAGVARRWKIAVDADHVIPHTMLRSSAGCPASSCPVDRIIELARGTQPARRVPRQSVVRTLTHTNLRRGEPSLQSPVIRVIPSGTEVMTPEFTDAGERVNGNPFWYGDGDDGYFWAGATDVPNPADDTLSPQIDAPSATTDEMELSAVPAVSPPPAHNAGLVIDRTTLALAAKEFLAEATRKDLVVLHFTAGRSARSAFDTWRNDPRHIATAYLVDVDGTIYEVFPPSFWASHLGVGGTKGLHDRRSIGIEIVNAGPLQRSLQDPAILNWWPPRSPGAPEFTTKFCRLDETDLYVEATYRGKGHFASFPVVQVDAVSALVRALCDEFSIPATLPALDRRFDCDVNAFATYTGVCTHANFRLDKWDIGPAFPWDRLGL